MDRAGISVVDGWKTAADFHPDCNRERMGVVICTGLADNRMRHMTDSAETPPHGETPSMNFAKMAKAGRKPRDFDLHAGDS